MKHNQLEQSLIFPATHPDGQEYIETAQIRNENVVAASSVWDSEIDGLVMLPYIHEESFPRCFMDLVSSHDISRIYAPVASVYSWLERFISENNLAIQLIGGSPIRREIECFDRLMNKVANNRSFIDQCAGGTSDLSDIEIAAVFRMAGNIYGESNEDKIAAMMSVFSSVPKGDVIEIGSLVGKSAAVLTWLARRYRIGNVLAIDPWQQEAATQQDSTDIVRMALLAEYEWEILSQDFVINMLPVGLGHFNYLRQKSVKGFERFSDNYAIVSQAFGQVNYQGKIAIIHIDGNHDYAKVRQDCELWLPLITPDGWLILDDYLWAHGDGPHRVGNALLEQRSQDIERAFICGKALFVKFRGQSPLDFSCALY